MWVEEDYCSPPLAMETESVLDKYFEDITVERVSSQKDGWKSLDYMPVHCLLVFRPDEFDSEDLSSHSGLE